MDLFQLLQSQLGDNVVDQLSKQIRSDKEKTSSAANGIFASLVSALSRNASQPSGAQALLGAIDRDHDGSVLDDVLGMFSGQGKQQQQKSMNGLGILDHVLGGKTNNVVQVVSQSSGLDFLKTGQLMQMLAPMVMGALGKAKKQQNLDQNGLSALLSNTVSEATNQRKEMSFISKILDADGDGSVMDELAGFGMKALGGLFKK